MKDKVAGAEDKCFCGTPVICQEYEYQGETKLQWRNKTDGKAHYRLQKDQNTGETITDDKGKPLFECRKNQSTSTGTVTPQTTEQVSLDETNPVVMWAQDTFKDEQLIRATLRSLIGKEPSDQHVGMYLKLRAQL